MCGCNKVQMSSNISSKNVSYTGACNKDLQYYITLLEIIKSMTPTKEVNLLNSFVKSQINIYDRNCIMYDFQIEELKQQLSI